MLNAVKHRLAFAFLYPKELIELVNLCTDIFTRLEARHDELAILRRIQDLAKRRVPLRCLLDVLDVAFHSFLIPSLGLLGRFGRNFMSNATSWAAMAIPQAQSTQRNQGWAGLRSRFEGGKPDDDDDKDCEMDQEAAERRFAEL